jgi:hypothetical protein
MHCTVDGETGKAETRKHDFEEFNVILERYGLWHPSIGRMGEIVRQLELIGAAAQ